MAGRPRTSIGTYGTIHVKRVGQRRYRARARVRDADGRLREVKATSRSGNRRAAFDRHGRPNRWYAACRVGRELPPIVAHENTSCTSLCGRPQQISPFRSVLVDV